MSPPRDEDDEAMSNPRVFDSLEDALASPTAEEMYLENLDDNEESDQ